MRQCVYLPLSLMTLNEMIDAQARARLVTNKATGKQVRISAYTGKKKQATAEVALLCRAGLVAVRAAFYTFLHVRTARNEDPDNFVAGAHKFVFDGLKASGVIPNDGWKQVLGFADFWQTGERPGVLVAIDPERTLTHAECVSELEKTWIKQSRKRTSSSRS